VDLFNFGHQKVDLDPDLERDLIRISVSSAALQIPLCRDSPFLKFFAASYIRSHSSHVHFIHTGYQNHYVTPVLPSEHDAMLKIPVCPVPTLCTGAVIGVPVRRSNLSLRCRSGSQHPNKGAKP
jgi:hypothetical protein